MRLTLPRNVQPALPKSEYNVSCASVIEASALTGTKCGTSKACVMHHDDLHAARLVAHTNAARALKSTR